MEYRDIHNAAQLIDYVNEIGMLPLLPLGVEGWSAEEQSDDEAQYAASPEGGWEWPLWEWKGSVIRESGCAYGKFFMNKAGFVSRELWPDFCNWRRSKYPKPAENSIEAVILEVLQMGGSMITRELRRACGFTEPKMRSKFDSYITRLEMACYIVTEDFVYPQDKHGKRYGWGYSLLTTPEQLFGHDACHPNCSPEESYQRLLSHLRQILSDASPKQIDQILK